MKNKHYRLKQDLEDICQVSKFFDPQNYKPCTLSSYSLKESLQYSHNRLKVIQSKFEKIGFETNIKEFKHRTFQAKNGIFRKEDTEKQIWITGHHDYCAGLGAEDNATALTVMLEIAKYFKDLEIAKNLVFASFNLEEQHLVGSNNYVNRLSEQELKKIKYLINLDCLGSGKDISICKKLYTTKSDKKLVKKIHNSAANLGYKFLKKSFKDFLGDNINFAKKNVKTVSLFSLNYKKLDTLLTDISIAHTEEDIPQNINIENLVKITETLIQFIKNESKLT